MRAARVLIWTALVAWLVGCNPEPTAVVTRIDVTPASILLRAAGDTKTVAAVARTAAGAAVDATVTWASSDSAVASVDAAGVVRGTAGVGTARVTASIGDVRSEPVLVTVATPAAGAILITDADVAAGPSAVDAGAGSNDAARYEVTLHAVPNVAVGAILINTEARPVAGRIVSVESAGNDLRVRLTVVPPQELFTAFEYEDRVDLAEGAFDIPAEISAAYDVKQDGGTFTFTPKAAQSGRAASAVLARYDGTSPAPAPATAAEGAQGTRALPPLPPFKECEADLGFGSGLPIPLSLSAPPSFTFTADGEAVREATPEGTTLTVRGTPTFTFTSELEVTSAFEAKIECKVTLARRQFRVPGWAGLFFGGDIEFGVGFELGGKVTLFSAKVGGSVEIKPTISAALTCPTRQPCALSGDVTAESTLTPTLEAPSIDQARFEPSVNLFGFVSLEAGNADIEALQFEAIEAKVGPELAASLALEAFQMSNADPDDGRSKYELALKGEIGPGVKLGDFLEYLGLSEVVPLELSFEVPLGESPTGAVTADRARYLPGERATVTVTLDAASTVFPSGGIYNVDRVVIMRGSGLTAQALATATATAGQTEFVVAFDAPGLIDAGELFAFVVTRLLPLDPPKLEIGAAAPRGTTPGTFAGTVTVTILGDSRNSDNVGNYMSATFTYDLQVRFDDQGNPIEATGTVRVTAFDAKENGSGCKSNFGFAGGGDEPVVTWSAADGVGRLAAVVSGTGTEAKRCSGGSTDDDSGTFRFNVPTVTWAPEFGPDGELVAIVFDGDQRADAGIGVGESDVRLRWSGRLERLP